MVERDIRSRVEAGSGEPAQGVVDSLQSDADDDDQEGGEDFIHLSGESRQGGQDDNDNVAGLSAFHVLTYFSKRLFEKL